MKAQFHLYAASSFACLAICVANFNSASAASAECVDVAMYTTSLEMLGNCRGPVGLSDDRPIGDSSAAFMTCLDKDLKAVLVKDLTEAIETGDKRKIQIAELSLETFRAYCKDVEAELSVVHNTIDDLVETQIGRLADAIWTRYWHPQFIDYVVDPTGYTRGLFSLDAWEVMRSNILKTFDSQWFFDQKARLSVSVLSQEITPLEDNRWEVDASITVRLFLEESEERFERELKEWYLIGANAQHVSDTNLAGLYLLETDADLKPVFEDIYERFPVGPEQEGGLDIKQESEN